MTTTRSILILLSVTATSALLGADVTANWADKCAKCHGATGLGDTKMGKKLNIADFSDAAVQAKFTDEQANKAIKEGLTDSTGKTTMKAIEGLNDDEIKALVVHVRALKK